MVGFPQSCLPLTSNLKTGPKTQLGNDTTADFNRLVEFLVRNSSGLKLEEEYYWIHDAESLWSPKLTLGDRRVHFFKSSPDTIVELLRRRTCWFKRLPKSGRNKVKILVQQEKGRRHLREILNTCDGVITSLLFSCPELFSNGYEFSDRVINMIIMNCFHSYSRFQGLLKKARKDIKKQYLESSSVELPTHIERTLSFLRPMLEVWRRSTSGARSKAMIFRIATFCQTRATGLADSKMSEDSIKSFLDTVQTPGRFEPNPLMEQARDIVIETVLGNPSYGKNSEFRISASTSACRETSKAKGGKFGFFKEFVRSNSLRVPSLESGRPGMLGNLMYSLAKDKFREKDPKVLEVNVAAVRENGKARVITSGSVFKESALQPYSHLTIHMIKTIPNLANGLRAGRLGWKFIRQIRPDEPKYDFIFNNDVYVMSMDWEKATDNPTHAMGRWVLEPLLRGAGVPDEDIEMIFYYLLSEKSLIRYGKEIGKLLRGIPMGDPLTKTILSLAHPICDLYARLKTHSLAVEEGNGDDVIAVSEIGHEYKEAYTECAVALGYNPSESDTFLTQDWGTYCEEWFHLPKHKTNTVKSSSKVQNSKMMPYLDVPKIRILIATAKDRREFSSDPSGKITMMAKEAEYQVGFDDNPANFNNFLASGIQDVTLAVDDQRFPYNLPRQILGLGKPEPAWHPEGWYSCIERYNRRKRAIVWFLIQLSLRGALGRIPKGHVKEALHFDKEMLIEHYQIPEDDPVREYILIPSDKRELFPPSVLQRLVDAKYLIPESKLIPYYLLQARIDEMNNIQSDTLASVETMVEQIEFVDPPKETWLATIQLFRERFYNRQWELSPSVDDNLYDFEAVRLLENGNPLRVTNLEMPILNRFANNHSVHNIHEREGEDLYGWFVDNFNTILQGGDFEYPDPTLLDDDPLIYRQCSLRETSHYVIVTDDKRLCRKIDRNIAGITLIHVSVPHMLSMTNESMDAEDFLWDLMPMYGVPIEDTTFLVDTGSVEAFLLMREHTPIAITKVDGFGWNANIKKSSYRKVPLSRSLPNTMTRKKVHPTKLGYPSEGLRYRERRR